MPFTSQFLAPQPPERGESTSLTLIYRRGNQTQRGEVRCPRPHNKCWKAGSRSCAPTTLPLLTPVGPWPPWGRAEHSESGNCFLLEVPPERMMGASRASRQHDHLAGSGSQCQASLDRIPLMLCPPVLGPVLW